jgi:hypothetical protein
LAEEPLEEPPLDVLPEEVPLLLLTVEPELVPAVEPELPAVESLPDEDAVPPSSCVSGDELDLPPQPTPTSAVTANVPARPTATCVWNFLLSM